MQGEMIYPLQYALNVFVNQHVPSWYQPVVRL